MTSNSASGWSIGDGRLYRTDETDSWSDSNTSLLIRIWGTISTDATLSDLTLEGADGGEAITLSPAFDADTDTYTAAVVNRIDAVKLTATKNDDNAMVVITNDDDDRHGEEALLDLIVGSNTLTVTVTAQDGTATRTYTVTVDRLAVPPPEVMVPSDWGLIPSDLGTGDQFRLLFLSSTETDATSADIADYNTFIQNLAAAGHADIQDYSAGFRAVGCTAAVNARNNTGTTGAGVPIYWLNGSQVADDYADFYDGNWDDEANDKNESGNNGPDTISGGQPPLHRLRSRRHGGGFRYLFACARRVSSAHRRPNDPVQPTAPSAASNVLTSSESRPMYGLSQVFEVHRHPHHLPGQQHASDSTAGDQPGLKLRASKPGTNAGWLHGLQVDMRLGIASGTKYTVKIRENNAAMNRAIWWPPSRTRGVDGRQPQHVHGRHDTNDPGSTTYWISVNEDISTSNRAQHAWEMTRPARPAGPSATTDGEMTKRIAGNTGSSSLLMTIKGTAIPTTTLVSNTHLSASLDTSSVTFQAQSFETGANADGYTVSEVDIRLGNVSGRSTSVKIRKNNADNEPGDLVATLTNPASLTADSLNTFTAPAGITLAASTTYWLTVNEGISSNRAQVDVNAGNDQTGETGWSIGDGRLWRNGETDAGPPQPLPC